MADIELHHEEEMDFEADTEKQVQKLKEAAKTRKGRGFGEETRTSAGGFDSLEDKAEVDKSGEPLRSVEGWIVFITGINEETEEDSLREKFEEFGEITNLKMSIDCRTGYVKGYALVEYKTFKEAESAIKALDDTEICGEKIAVDWAFVKESSKKNESRRDNRREVRATDRREVRAPNRRNGTSSFYERRNDRRDDRGSPRRERRRF